MHSRGPLGNERRVHAILLDLLLNVVVEPGNKCRHQHDHADAEHDSEDRECAAHFVRAQRVQCLLQAFAMLLRHVCPQVSVRSASMGSSLAGAMQEKIPKKAPPEVASTMKRITAEMGVVMGKEIVALTSQTTP